MFIIPIKVDWPGVVYGAFLVYEMISGMLMNGETLDLYILL